MIIKFPDSISALVYSMKHPYLWTLMVWTIAIIGYIFMASKPFIPLSFISCACISFVGCMPLIKGEHNTAHWILGILGCVFSQIWCICVVGILPMLVWWYFYCILMTILICIEKADTWCFWLELWCIIGVLIVL